MTVTAVLSNGSRVLNGVLSHDLFRLQASKGQQLPFSRRLGRVEEGKVHGDHLVCHLMSQVHSGQRVGRRAPGAVCLGSSAAAIRSVG